jgi:hypothetical protein
VVLALIVIPYFNINIEAEGVWLRNRDRRLRIFIGVLRCSPQSCRLPRLRGADSNAADCGLHVLPPRRVRRAAFPAMAGFETALLLDHDVVSGAGRHSDGDRDILPRPGLVVRVALEEMNACEGRYAVAIPVRR